MAAEIKRRYIYYNIYIFFNMFININTSLPPSPPQQNRKTPKETKKQ